MSSFHSSGLAAMNSAIIVTHRSSSSSVIATPCSASQSCPPVNVPTLPDHHGPDVELAHQPAAVPARRQRRDHDRGAVVALPARRCGRRPSRRAPTGRRPARGGCDRCRAARRRRLNSAAPIGMPPSAKPFRASSTATSSICSASYRRRPAPRRSWTGTAPGRPRRRAGSRRRT